MLNRRLIRIKVFKVLYSSVFSGTDSVAECQKELLYSCEKTLHLYYLMLNISQALVLAGEAKIDNGLKKFHPSEDELNPNRKFVENAYAERIARNKQFVDFCEKHGLLWSGDVLSKFVRKVFAHICEQDYYKEYMASADKSLKEDCDLYIKIFQEEFEDNEELASILEDMSLYWMDDLAYVLNVIIRNIELLRDKSMSVTPDVFMKEDDKEFATELMMTSISNYKKYMDIIAQNVSNWDSDRLVATDLTLIEQGVAEAVKFENIPIKVTINEYVEISKFYSTQNSKVFVNGLLDTIIQKMVASGEIVKKGRGLIDS